MVDPGELARREEVGLQAIRASHGTEVGEFGATLFVSHHLEELDASYWQEQLGTEEPSAEQVLGLLRARADWDGEEMLDFVLPGDASSYVLAVEFDEDGGVANIAMES